MAAPEERIVMSVDYEVYGKVQGCFFRKHLFAKCKELGLKGWVRNTRTGTVIGTIQGEPEPIAEMKNWLMYVGSPNSRIATCEFNNERRIQVEEYPEFTILHN